MQRRQVHVRVRIGSGEVIDALVLEWLSYPDRALVQLPSRQRPSVVRRNAATDVYSPRSLPMPTPQLIVVLAGLVTGGVLLGFLVPPSPSARPAAPAATTAWTPPPAAESEPAQLVPTPPAPSRSPSPAPLVPTPTPARPAPARPPQPPPAAAIIVPPARANAAPSHAKPDSPAPAHYEARLTALPAEAAHRRTHTCACGAAFHSATELQAHRTGVVYACIRYPACQATATNPDAILKHYEKARDGGGRCWFEAVRLGSAYAVVKRPKCRTLAADPNRRKVIRMRVRPNTLDDDNPWH